MKSTCSIFEFYPSSWFLVLDRHRIKLLNYKKAVKVQLWTQLGRECRTPFHWMHSNECEVTICQGGFNLDYCPQQGFRFDGLKGSFYSSPLWFKWYYSDLYYAMWNSIMKCEEVCLHLHINPQNEQNVYWSAEKKKVKLNPLASLLGAVCFWLQSF